MKWNKEQIKAMEGSIAKWQSVLEGAKEHGSSDCPCCKLYGVSVYGIDECDGCPIKEVTGENGCHGTPYHLWNIFEMNWEENDTAYAELRQEKAQAMLTCLEDILASMKKDNAKLDSKEG